MANPQSSYTNETIFAVKHLTHYDFCTVDKSLFIAKSKRHLVNHKALTNITTLTNTQLGLSLLFVILHLTVTSINHREGAKAASY